MKTVHINPSNDFLTAVADQMRGDDSVIALVPPVKAETYAPSKKGRNKGYHRLKVEFWIPEEAIIGEDALIDFGLSAFMRLPNGRISGEFLSQDK